MQLTKVISDSTIEVGRAITIDTWDETHKCFKIRKPTSDADPIKGITIIEVTASVPIYRAIQTSGTLDHLDTSTFNQGDTLYSMLTTGALNTTSTHQQKLAIVRKSHATLGRIVLFDLSQAQNPPIPWEEEFNIPADTNSITLTHLALEKGILVLLDGFPMGPSNYTKNLTGNYVQSLTFNDTLYSGNTVTIFYTRPG